MVYPPASLGLYNTAEAVYSHNLNANGDSSMVLIESSELLDTLKLLHTFAATFSLQEASKAYDNVIYLVQLMEKESSEDRAYIQRDVCTERLT
ncbi:MAG: hypothetical protein KK926_04275 [Methanomethylovorans sp.]|nr:hypothetical protein [Methanomethylovorans sp.]